MPSELSYHIVHRMLRADGRPAPVAWGVLATTVACAFTVGFGARAAEHAAPAARHAPVVASEDSFLLAKPPGLAAAAPVPALRDAPAARHRRAHRTKPAATVPTLVAAPAATATATPLPTPAATAPRPVIVAVPTPRPVAAKPAPTPPPGPIFDSSG